MTPTLSVAHVACTSVTPHCVLTNLLTGMSAHRTFVDVYKNAIDIQKLVKAFSYQCMYIHWSLVCIQLDRCKRRNHQYPDSHVCIGQCPYDIRQYLYKDNCAWEVHIRAISRKNCLGG